jgi:hypothetical protein
VVEGEDVRRRSLAAIACAEKVRGMSGVRTDECYFVRDVDLRRD